MVKLGIESQLLCRVQDCIGWRRQGSQAKQLEVHDDGMQTGMQTGTKAVQLLLGASRAITPLSPRSLSYPVLCPTTITELVSFPQAASGRRTRHTSSVPKKKQDESRTLTERYGCHCYAGNPRRWRRLELKLFPPPCTSLIFPTPSVLRRRS